MSDADQKAIEAEAPSVIVIFEGPHSTNGSVAYSDVKLDVGQLIIARELIQREIDNQFKMFDSALRGIDPRKRGLVLPRQ